MISLIEVVVPIAMAVFSLMVLAVIRWMVGRVLHSAFVIGVGLLILTLVVQPPIQRMPILLLGIDLDSVSFPIVAVILLYMAMVSGFLQELLKLICVKGKAIGYALWLGAGFGFGEAGLAILGQVLSIMAGVGFDLNVGLMSIYERIMAMLYHILSSALLCYFYARGKGVMIYMVVATIHSLVNYQAALLVRIYGLDLLVLALIYSTLTIVNLSMLIVCWRRIAPWLKVNMYSTA